MKRERTAKGPRVLMKAAALPVQGFSVATPSLPPLDLLKQLHDPVQGYHVFHLGSEQGPSNQLLQLATDFLLFDVLLCFELSASLTMHSDVSIHLHVALEDDGGIRPDVPCNASILCVFALRVVPRCSSDSCQCTL